MLSADGRVDYASMLERVKAPTLMVAGQADIISDIPSTELTYRALSSPDKTLMKFGTSFGQVADYGHCDLVWSRHAPREIFPPVIDWLDRHQPAPSVAPTGQTQEALTAVQHAEVSRTSIPDQN